MTFARTEIPTRFPERESSFSVVRGRQSTPENEYADKSPIRSYKPVFVDVSKASQAATVHLAYRKSAIEGMRREK